MQEPLKSEEAISPILGTLLIIVIVVTVAIASYAWVMSFTTSQTEKTGEFLSVVNVDWSNSSKIVVDIINSGTADAKILKVYLGTSSTGRTEQSSVSYSPSNTVSKDGGTVRVTITYSWASGTRYYFRFLTEAGNNWDHDERTPYKPPKVWYNPSWTRRKPVTIDNTLNLNDLINYQVKINVQYDSDMNNDFSDLRFTDDDGQTLIPYWIESYVTLDYAIVWVNIPSISACSTKTIYMYYGNPSASSESNPDYTFDVFANFTRDGMISHGGSSQDIDSTQWEIMNDTTLRMWGNNWKATMKTLNVTGDGSQAICFDFRSVGTQGEINGVGLDIDSSLSNNWFYRIYGTQGWGINDHYGYTGGGDWQYYSLILNDFSGIFNRFIFANDADAGQATNIYYRNVRVCKYTSPEPTINVGTEETL